MGSITTANNSIRTNTEYGLAKFITQPLGLI